jgi:hypothetical protein
VGRIADNGYGTFQPENGGSTISIIPSKVKEYGLAQEQPIEVVIKTEGNKNLIQEIRILINTPAGRSLLTTSQR